MTIVVRVGLPQVNGSLPKAAVESRMPVLFSANAFRRNGRWQRISPVLECLDAALDSAGFVAMVRYGGYPWSRGEYLDLAAAHPWAWYATRDYCCEPQIAASREQVAERVRQTAAEYWALRSEAEARGMPGPMPVIQGWLPEEYERCVDLYRLTDWPSIVGVGSVCRRNLRGHDGIARVVERLDRCLPSHTRLHLFGVKGPAIEALRTHPRIASIDSMAWDFAARREPGPSTMSKRIRHMRGWYAQVTDALDTRSDLPDLFSFGDRSRSAEGARVRTGSSPVNSPRSQGRGAF